MKTGKEIKLKNFKNFNVILGSINNKQSRALYIRIFAWGQPKNEEEINYYRSIRNINKKIKQNLFNQISSGLYPMFIKDRTIVDLDIKESGIKHGKKSFMNCEITLFMKEESIFNTESNLKYLNDITEYVIEKILNDDVDFKFFKKKKI